MFASFFLYPQFFCSKRCRPGLRRIHRHLVVRARGRLPEEVILLAGHHIRTTKIRSGRNGMRMGGTSGTMTEIERMTMGGVEGVGVLRWMSVRY